MVLTRRSLDVVKVDRLLVTMPIRSLDVVKVDRLGGHDKEIFECQHRQV